MSVRGSEETFTSWLRGIFRGEDQAVIGVFLFLFTPFSVMLVLLSMPRGLFPVYGLLLLITTVSGSLSSGQLQLQVKARAITALLLAVFLGLAYIGGFALFIQMWIQDIDLNAPMRDFRMEEGLATDVYNATAWCISAIAFLFPPLATYFTGVGLGKLSDRIAGWVVSIMPGRLIGR